MGLFSAMFNPGEQWGTNSMIGSALNNITGASGSARQQYQNNMSLQKNAQEFAKWQMANAHQMEVQDLQNAGLNPVLSANGGASAGVSANSTGSGTPSGNPIEMIGNIFSMLNTAKQTNATVEKTKSDIINQTNLTNAEIDKIYTEINNINANTRKTNQNYDIDVPDTTEANIDEELGKTMIGRAFRSYGNFLKWGNAKLRGVGASAINAITSARNANRMAKAIENTPHTHVHYH